jgi:hypothetical protein
LTTGIEGVSIEGPGFGAQDVGKRIKMTIAAEAKNGNFISLALMILKIH